MNATSPKPKRQKQAKSARKYTVYGIENTVTKKWYIGITRRRISVRKYDHLYKLRRNEHHSAKLQNSFNKHGESAFIFHVLDVGVPEKDIEKMENDYMSEGMYNSINNGYNMKEGRLPISNRYKCVFEGIEYESLQQCADSNNVTRQRLAKYLTNGVVILPEKNNLPRRSSWGGVEYSSISEAARASGKSHSLMSRFLEKGYTCDADITDKLETRKRPFSWEGTSYQSIEQAAKALGVTRSTIRYYRSKGYTGKDDMIKSQWKTSNAYSPQTA